MVKAAEIATRRCDQGRGANRVSLNLARAQIQVTPAQSLVR
jgi:hypothetical protein